MIRDMLVYKSKRNPPKQSYETDINTSCELPSHFMF
jgi:hypothetical protein